MTITVVFDPPLPSDAPAAFNTKAFSTLGDLNTWSTQANALAVDVSAGEASAAASAGTAGTHAATATAKAAEAFSSANSASTSAGTATTQAGIATTKASEANASAIAAAASAASIDPATIAAKTTGPASATDNTLPRFDGTTGKLLQGSGVVVDDNNNMGLGVTPSAWSVKAIDVPDNYSFGHLGFSNNAYYNGSWLYKTTAGASVYQQVGGEHRWYTALSGTAGSSLTFTSAMTLSAAGELGIGTAPASGKALALNSASNYFGINFLVGGSTIGTIMQESTGNMYYDANSNGAGGGHIFRNAGATKATLDASGNLALNSGTLGYGTGAGGTVTQTGNKATAVTLNKPSGQITTHSASLAAGATVYFALYNSHITSIDTMVFSLFGGGAAQDKYAISAGTYAGGAYISIRNTTGSALGEPLIINFTVIKGAST